MLRDEWKLDRQGCARMILADDALVRAALAAGVSPLPRKSARFFCPSNTCQDVGDLCDLHPEVADRILAIEAAAAPNLTTLHGLWRRPRKGARGTEPRPGSMSEFIHAYRAEQAGKRTVPLPVLSPAARQAA